MIVRITIQIKKRKTRIKPGNIEAMKRVPIGTFKTLPRRTSTILGGIICPKVPEAIIIPVAVSGL
jgi:hypothetical protein